MFIIFSFFIDFAFKDSINLTELKSTVSNLRLFKRWNIRGIRDKGKSHKNGERKKSILNREN